MSALNRRRIAIVGSGIAGLGCAHFLHRDFDITVFDGGDHIGGHTHTVDVPEGGRAVSFDTGFMVFNEVTYPLLIRLFRELKVPVQPTSMSFSVQHVPSGLEFNGTSVNHLFAQRRNLLRPRFWAMLRQVDRFNREATEMLSDPCRPEISLGDFVEERRYGRDFFDLYLVPMSSAVWSTPPDRMREFPALTLLRFFHNHGFLGLHTQHPWFTVTGGAREYVRRMTPPFERNIRLRTPVRRIVRKSDGVDVVLDGGRVESFEKVILACHADQALAMLERPGDDERSCLSEFKYQPNPAIVHTDESLMPGKRLAWASWNYRMDAGDDGTILPQTIYWMNRLQGVSDRANYFVSIHGESRIRPEKIIRRIPYEHPLFTLGAVRAQALLPGLNACGESRRTYYCGSYFKYGFHEDAFASAVELSRLILGRDPWEI